MTLPEDPRILDWPRYSGDSMDKRLTKRHKRQVARARERVQVSEPDVRTPEEIEAAREASRPDISRGTNPGPHGAAQPVRSNRATSTGSAAKTSV